MTRWFVYWILMLVAPELLAAEAGPPKLLSSGDDVGTLRAKQETCSLRWAPDFADSAFPHPPILIVEDDTFGTYPDPSGDWVTPRYQIAVTAPAIEVSMKIELIVPDFDALILTTNGRRRYLPNIWEEGIEDAWNRQGSFARASTGHVEYEIKFDVQFVEQGGHAAVRVESGKGSWTASRWYAGEPREVRDHAQAAAHEFGHLLGLYDEYCRAQRTRYALPGVQLCEVTGREFATRQPTFFQNAITNSLMADGGPTTAEHYAEILNNLTVFSRPLELSLTDPESADLPARFPDVNRD